MDPKEEVIATVVQADEKSLAKEVTDIEFQADSLVVNSDAEYEQAAEFGKMLKRKASQVTEFFKPMKDAAYQAHKAVCDREKVMLQPLRMAEATVKATMGGYIAEKERKHKEQEEAMRRAARAESDRLLQEAAAQEKKGNAEGANEAFNEAVVMDEAATLASSAEKNPKVSGVRISKDWEIVSIDDGKVPIEVNGATIRPVDRSALLHLIRASKGLLNIPGVSYKEVDKMSFSRR